MFDISVIESEYSNINGIVVVKGKETICETYFHGFGKKDVHHVASVTKSVISALIGIALEKGYIKSIDQKVLDFFPEFPDEDGQGQRKQVTIRNLLSMTAPYPFENGKEPLEQFSMSKDWTNYALSQLGQKGKIGEFLYSTQGAHLLSVILTKATGKSAREFANEFLFVPAGMRVIPEHKIEEFGFDTLFGSKLEGWAYDPQKNSTGGWGLTLTTEDMARFGVVYLNQGKWNKKQIVPKKWIEDSVQMTPYHYGYLWWLIKEEDFSAYAAMGDGGNVICCIPDKDMVIAIASTVIPNPKDRIELMRKVILPACKG